MKRGMRIASVTLLMALISLASFAQDNQEITDKQLWKYALMQEVVDVMKKDISIELNKMIKSQEGMTGQRYKELASTKGDTDKLAAIEAKDWELQFFNLTTTLKDDRTDAIKTVNSLMATKMVGNKGKTYKAIKAQLKADTELKSRYDTIVASMKAEEVKAD